MRFLSTPSARRATGDSSRKIRAPYISIHALREEGDRKMLLSPRPPENFYPRPPRGGRRLNFQFSFFRSLFLSTPSARRATWVLDRDSPRPEFLSTPSARRATGAAVVRGCPDGISIHALREEGDRSVWATLKHQIIFLSTPSARRATARAGQRQRAKKISIHALREEGDSKNRDKISIFKQIIQHSARI